MSIVDAIQKAKRLAQDRQLEEAAAPRKAPKRAPAAPVHDTVPVPISNAVLEPLKIEQLLPYDPVICSKFHVAVPGAQPRLLLAAAAPYRMLRTLMLQRARTQNISTIAITSPGPGEGKSTTAINLALTMAREGNYDVFLFDMDMRFPKMCSYLGVQPPRDLADYFRGSVELDQVLFSIGIDQLFLAGNSAATDNSSELLGNGRLEELIEWVRERSANPLVILDLPPVGVTDDALVVAPKVDTTVLIAAQGRTRREGLQRAVSLLSEHGLAGVILNRSSESIGADYYGTYGG